MEKCANVDKHEAIEASLQRIVKILGCLDVEALIETLMSTHTFLQSWVVYRDDYLLHPKFNKEGLCSGGETMEQLFEHILREVNGRSLTATRLGKYSGGHSHTIRLYSSLVMSLNTPGKFVKNGQTQDDNYQWQRCCELYALVKHLRKEYVHGHGSLIDVIEKKYPCKWLNPAAKELEEESEQEDVRSIPESDISEYQPPPSDIELVVETGTNRWGDEDDNAVHKYDTEEEAAIERFLRDWKEDKKVYYAGFTDDEVSDEEEDEDEEIQEKNDKTNVDHAHTRQAQKSSDSYRDRSIQQTSNLPAIIYGREARTIIPQYPREIGLKVPQDRVQKKLVQQQPVMQSPNDRVNNTFGFRQNLSLTQPAAVSHCANTFPTRAPIDRFDFLEDVSWALSAQKDPLELQKEVETNRQYRTHVPSQTSAERLQSDVHSFSTSQQPAAPVKLEALVPRSSIEDKTLSGIEESPCTRLAPNKPQSFFIIKPRA